MVLLVYIITWLIYSISSLGFSQTLKVKYVSSRLQHQNTQTVQSIKQYKKENLFMQT